MKYGLKILSGFVLLMNGVSAMYGGWHLMKHPDGSSLGMPLYHLAHSPFENFLIPGIILFIANGLFSLFVFFALIFRLGNYSLLVLAQGAILTGWIVIQCFMLQSVGPLHIIFGAAGMTLIISGFLLSGNHSQSLRRPVHDRPASS